MKHSELYKAFEDFCHRLNLPVAEHARDGGKYWLDYQPRGGGCLIRYIVDDGGGWLTPFFPGSGGTPWPIENQSRWVTKWPAASMILRLANHWASAGPAWWSASTGQQRRATSSRDQAKPMLS
jgi:hypothetical protein